MTGADRGTGTVERVACGHDLADVSSVPSSREQASARHDALSLFRIYGAEECYGDGYPMAWHGLADQDRFAIKNLVREEAGDRCERCKHPYRKGQHPMELADVTEDGKAIYVSWSPCDERCEHGMPARCIQHPFESLGANTTTGGLIRDAQAQGVERSIEARARILTVHHLNGNKADCRWYNLSALCQRCHLHIQGKVVMEQVYPHEHSEWFKPHAAAYYAQTYLGEYLTRAQTMARLDELLALERLA